jgi:translation elongation factor EF-1alpha
VLRDEVNWSEDAFIRSVQATRTVFQELGDFKEQYARRRILYVPASGLHGDNLLELSSSLGWYSKITGSGEEGLEGAVTAVAALDRILS